MKVTKTNTLTKSVTTGKIPNTNNPLKLCSLGTTFKISRQPIDSRVSLDQVLYVSKVKVEGNQPRKIQERQTNTTTHSIEPRKSPHLSFFWWILHSTIILDPFIHKVKVVIGSGEKKKKKTWWHIPPFLFSRDLKNLIW